MGTWRSVRYTPTLWSTGADRGRSTVDRQHAATIIGVAVAVILFGWFALANLNNVRIHFWVFHPQAPLILVIVISGLLGADHRARSCSASPEQPKE